MELREFEVGPYTILLQVAPYLTVIDVHITATGEEVAFPSREWVKEVADAIGAILEEGHHTARGRTR